MREGWDFTYELARGEFSPDPESDSTFIHNLRTTYYFNKDLNLKLFYRSRQLPSGETGTETDWETLQCIFVWRILPPFGQHQLAYLNGPAKVTESAQRLHTFFVKLAWVFQR